MTLHLVVDNGRAWPPREDEEVLARARVRNEWIERHTRARVLAWRARHETSGGCPEASRGAPPLQARTLLGREHAGADCGDDPAARRSIASPSRRSSDGLALALPYVVAGCAAIAGFVLAYLFGGVR